MNEAYIFSKTFLLSLCLSIVLSACSSAESDARKAVLEKLKDPDSAKFGQFTLINEHGACLAVNAKNSMGGFTGEQQAMLIRGDEEWEVADFSKLNHDQCISVVQSLDLSALQNRK